MKYVSCRTLLLGLIAASAFTSHSTHAATVSAVGSFNDPSASSMYFYNRIYNQDDSASPTRQLPNNLGSTTDSVAYFGWGVDVAESFSNRQIIQSHFWFNGVGSEGGDPAASTSFGSAFSLGSFTYTNQPTILSGGVVNIDFQLNINVDGYDLFPVEYRLQIDNTSNQLPNSSDTARLIGMADD
ncbi:MAG TPA: choice-of-anchor K domain-containing protein, partial [Gammaproteobacteria bacterium]